MIYAYSTYRLYNNKYNMKISTSSMLFFALYFLLGLFINYLPCKEIINTGGNVPRLQLHCATLKVIRKISTK